MNESVLLSSKTKHRLFEIACPRHETKDPKWSKTKLKEWEVHSHVSGVKGEYAFGKLAGLPLDTNVYQYGDGGYDHRLPNGLSVNTRYNHKIDGILFCEDPADFSADIIVLLTGECWPDPNPKRNICHCRDLDVTERIHFAGWIERDRFFKECGKKDFGLGKRWWMPIRMLNKSLQQLLKGN